MTSAADLRIGIALSGGGAAGLAHVGVLEELAAAGIEPQCVAGTSAGAIVGAAFAADRLRPFRDTMSSLTRTQVLGLFDLTWPHSGFLEGRRGLELIRPYVGTRIETLPRPYAAVATDLATGNEVRLREGDVLEAIRASIAIPGLFTPQHLGGRLLVDGGLVNPIPVDVVRQLGARFVIAVSLLDLGDDQKSSSPENGHGMPAPMLARLLAVLNPETPSTATSRYSPRGAATALATDPGLVAVLSRATEIVQARIARARMREQPPDCLITISLPEIALFDLHRVPEAIAAGREAARTALAAIRHALARTQPMRQRFRRWLGD